MNMQDASSLLTGQRAATPAWFWIAVCQERFFYTQEGRDALTGTPLRQESARGFLQAVRAVTREETQIDGVHGALQSMFLRFFVDTRLRTEPQAQWKAALVLQAVAASKNIRQDGYVEWIRFCIRTKRPRDPEPEDDPRLVQAHKALDTFLHNHQAAQVVRKNIEKQPRQTWHSPKERLSRKACRAYLSLLTRRTLPEGWTIAFMVQSAISLPRQKCIERKFSHAPTRMFVFPNHQRTHQSKDQTESAHYTLCVVRQNMSQQREVSSALMFLGDFKHEEDRNMAAEDKVQRHLSDHDGQSALPKKWHSGYLANQRINAWHCMGDVLKRIMEGVSWEHTHGRWVRQIQGRAADMAFLRGAIPAEGFGHPPLLVLDGDHIDTTFEAFLELNRYTALTLVATMRHSTYLEWKAAAETLCADAQYECLRGREEFLQRPHVFSLRRYGLYCVMVVAAKEGNGTLTQNLGAIMRCIPTSVRPRYYDWEHRRWISTKSYRVEWHPMEDYSRTYGGPTRWIHYEALLSQANPPCTEPVTVRSMAPDSWRPVTQIIDSNVGSPPTVLVRGLPTELTPYILAFLSVYDAVHYLLRVQKRFSVWFRPWRNFLYHCNKVNIMRNFDRNFVFEVKVGRDSAFPLSPLRPVVAAMIFQDLRRWPLSRAVRRVILPLLHPFTEAYGGVGIHIFFARRKGASSGDHARFLVAQFDDENDTTVIFRIMCSEVAKNIQGAVSDTFQFRDCTTGYVW